MLVATGSMGVAGQSSGDGLLAFDAISIRPARNTGGSWGTRFTKTGYSAWGVRLTALIEDAYGLDWGSFRVEGVPPELNKQQFDIEARMDAEDEARYARMKTEERMLLLRAMLRDRFKLSARWEQRARDVFVLEVDKAGARVGEPLIEKEAERAGAGIRRMQPGLLEVNRLSMAGLARTLTSWAGGLIVDRTGLTGLRQFKLQWTPTGEEEASFPDLATALREQLGLRLLATRLPVDMVMISHAEAPSEN